MTPTSSSNPREQSGPLRFCWRRGNLPVSLAGRVPVKVDGSSGSPRKRGHQVEFVDFTYLLVTPFDPDEATLKLVKQLKTQRPVPLQELGHQQDQGHR